MPFAAIGVLRPLLLVGIIIIISAIDTAAISHAFLELLFIGRIPGTEVTVGFESFFAGIIFFAWALATYEFTMRGIGMIVESLKTAPSTQTDIEEIAL